MLDDLVKIPRSSGSVRFRFLSPKPKGQFYYTHRIHRYKSGQSFSNVICLKERDKTAKYFGECPLCEIGGALWKDHDIHVLEGSREGEPLKNLYVQFKPVERFYYNVYEYDSQQVKIFSAAKGLHSLIIENIIGDEYKKIVGLGDVTDEVHGRDFMLVKKLIMYFPTYDDSYFLEPSPLNCGSLKPFHLDSKLNHSKESKELKSFDISSNIAKDIKNDGLKIKENTKAALSKHAGVLMNTDEELYEDIIL